MLRKPLIFLPFTVANRSKEGILQSTVGACIDRRGVEHVPYLDFGKIFVAYNTSKLGKDILNTAIYREYENSRKTILRWGSSKVYC